MDIEPYAEVAYHHGLHPIVRGVQDIDFRDYELMVGLNGIDTAKHVEADAIGIVQFAGVYGQADVASHIVQM